jgi:hypothetical protein
MDASLDNLNAPAHNSSVHLATVPDFHHEDAQSVVLNAGYDAVEQLRSSILDEDMVALEKDIIANPEAGDLVRGTGGLRKIRLGQRSVGRGKRVP